MTYPRGLILLCLLMTAAAASGGRGFDRKSENDDEQRERREADRVTDLPGQPQVPFQHYAGYVNVRQQSSKALFYWFFEAQDAVSERPLVLWLNGGPGCSSVAYGAAQELGPFLVRNGSKLKLNKYSWNRVANMLFVEAPVGVGFSYTNNSEDLKSLGDKVTAEDSYDFLVGWFKRFPMFKSHAFYITGESYAGHYVPQLAELIYERNQRAKESYINFKGFMIGNAVINDATDMAGLVDYAWNHAIISDEVHQGIVKECNFTSDKGTPLCNILFKGLMDAYEEIDIYSIYTPVCLSSLSSRRKTTRNNLYHPSRVFKPDFWNLLPSGYDPCTQTYAENYFNTLDVQKALHANVTSLPYPYTACSGVIEKWNDSVDTVLPILRKLMNGGIRIWIYSGDTDGRVPVTSTRYSLNEMGLNITRSWRPWFHGKQVAGWAVVYEHGLMFATVRGAGHQVPVLRAHQSLSLFSHFVSAHYLPSSRF